MVISASAAITNWQTCTTKNYKPQIRRLGNIDSDRLNKLEYY
jgi:hypothetical protein